MKKFIYGLIIGITITSSTNVLAVAEEVIAKFTNYNFIVNGETKTMDTMPLTYNGTSYLPVRALSNMLGYDVTFKADSNTIELNTSVSNDTNNDVATNNNETTSNEIEYVKMNFGETYTKNGVSVTLNYEPIDTSVLSELELLTHPEFKNNPRKINIKIILDDSTVLNGSLWNMQLITDNSKYNFGEGKLHDRNSSGRIDYGETYEIQQIISDTDDYSIIGIKFYIHSKNIYLEYNF